jgi:hypothetical protein
MFTQNQLNKINLILENKIFTYNGDVFSRGFLNFNYKIKLTGYKKLIHIGEWTDFIKVDVEVVGFNNPVTEHVFDNGIITQDNIPFILKREVDLEITDFLRIFGDNIRVLIDKFDIKKTKGETITESKMRRSAIRNVVKDIINKVKDKKSGEFYLPENEDEMYIFDKIPFHFSVELFLRVDHEINDYQINGFYSPEDDVIELMILFNPKTIDKQMYDLVGEVNEIIAHELEHGFQEYHGELDRDVDSEEIEDSLEYYTQEHEIPAQYRGFKRLAKLRKEPLSVTAKHWFKTHKDIHGLSDDEVKIVLDKILSYKP